MKFWFCLKSHYHDRYPKNGPVSLETVRDRTIFYFILWRTHQLSSTLKSAYSKIADTGSHSARCGRGNSLHSKPVISHAGNQLIIHAATR